MAAHWYVLSVKPHKERTVYTHLRNEDITTYYPVVKVTPVNPRSRKERPFFPGYLFVQVDLQQEGDNRLRWLPGTRGLVRFGDRPAIVPDNLIAELHTKLQEFEEAAKEQKELQKGDRVRIIDGPFAGYEAIFDAHLSGKDRVQVLLAFLSDHSHRLRLNTRDVKKI